MVLLLLACADPGSPQEGYLLLDGPALDAGWLVETVDEEVLSTALPVPEVLEPVLVDPAGERFEVELYPGELSLVEGEQGDIDWALLGEDVARDALELVGDEAALELVMEQVEGQAELLDVGLWLVQGPEIVEQIAWIEEEPAGLYAIYPLDDPAFVEATVSVDSGLQSLSFGERIASLEQRVEALGGGGVSSRQASGSLETLLRGERAELQASLEPWRWVGAWDVDGRCVVLDAAGGVDDCRGGDLGTWSLDNPVPTLSFQLDSDQRTWEMR